MPRSYSALPYPKKPDLMLKAPDYPTYLDQEYYGQNYQPGRLVDPKVDVAEKLLRTLLGIERLAQSAKFTVYRFSTGIGVSWPAYPEDPSDKRVWTAMMHYPKDGAEPVVEAEAPKPAVRRRKAAAE